MADSKSKTTRSSDSLASKLKGRVPADTIPRDAVDAAEEEQNATLQRIQELKRTAVAPADYSAAKAAEDQAERLYNERADRGEWLSLAEKVGNAITRIGAAHAGNQIGADLSKIDYGPGIDWEGRNRRYAADLDRSLSRGKTERAAIDQAQETEAKLADRNFQDTLHGLETEYDAKRNKYNQETDTYQQALRDRDSFERQERSLRASEARAENRQRSSEERESNRRTASESDALLKMQVSDLQKQLVEAEKDAEAASQAAQILKSQPDLSKKTGEKLMTNYPAVMARAGITPEQMASIDEQAVEPGRLWGTNPSEKKRQELIQETLINPKLEKVKTIRQALDAKLAGQGMSKSSSSSESEQKQTAGKQPSEADIAKYVKMYPQVTPDQARDILTKRMNG